MSTASRPSRSIFVTTRDSPLTYLGKHVAELRTLRCEHGAAHALVREPIIDAVTGALDLHALIVRGLILRADASVSESRHAVSLQVLEMDVRIADVSGKVQA